jgi:hypothetical protein
MGPMGPSLLKEAKGVVRKMNTNQAVEKSLIARRIE